jgi:hypothetical protein
VHYLRRWFMPISYLMIIKFLSCWSVLFLSFACFHAFHRDLLFSVLSSNSYNNEIPYNSKISLLSLALRWEKLDDRLLTVESSILARFSTRYWVFLLGISSLASYISSCYTPSQLEDINNTYIHLQTQRWC